VKAALQEYMFLPHPSYPLDKQLEEMPLICKPDGKPYNPSYFSKMFSIFLKAHGLPAIRFHDLRHAYAMHAHYSGMPVKALTVSMGHRSAVTVLDNYVHIQDAHTAP
jgi:integrase